MSELGPTRRKILLLHGYAQNAYIMKQMMAAIITECDNDLEFYFLDAPVVLLPSDYPRGCDAIATPSSPPKFPATLMATTSPSYSRTPRAWFKVDGNSSNFSELDVSLPLLLDVLNEHRFEAIFGFSQGASVAEYIASMLECPQLYPSFFKVGNSCPQPLRFIIAVSGYLCRGPCRSWETPPTFESLRDPFMLIETPVLHVIGRTDIVIFRERAEVFIGYSKNRRVEEHVGGHFIPSRLRWRKFFAQFFRDPFGEIDSPSISSLEEDFYMGHMPPEFSLRVGRTLPAAIDGDEDRSTRSLTPDSLASPFPETPTRVDFISTPTVLERSKDEIMHFDALWDLENNDGPGVV